MTPMKLAVVAYDEAVTQGRVAPARVQAAITVYLTALSEDEGTVDRVARAIWIATSIDTVDQRDRNWLGHRWDRPDGYSPNEREIYFKKARRALKILAAKEPTP